MKENGPLPTGKDGGFKDNSERKMYMALRQNPDIKYDPEEDEVSETEYLKRKQLRNGRTDGSGSTGREAAASSVRRAGRNDGASSVRRTGSGTTGSFANRNGNASGSGRQPAHRTKAPEKLTDRELYELVKKPGHRPLTDREKLRYKSYRKKRKKLRIGRRRYFLFLAVYAVLIILLGVRFLFYVNKCLVQFEAAQDYNAIGELVSDFEEDIRNGNISEQLDIPEDSCRFEAEDTFLQLYLQKLQNIGELTYEKNKRSYDASAPIYDIYSDGEIIARMTLKSENRRKVFGILELCDWKVDTITPALSVMTNTYRYVLPETYTLKLNGITATEEDRTGEETANTYGLNDEIFDYVTFPKTVTYEISGLVKEPEVEILDADGNAVDFTADENGNVTVASEPEQPSSMPEERRSFALEAAEAWADFTNLDLPGDNIGIATMVKYFIKDSFYYNEAYNYLTSDARWTISDHVDADPKFSDITVDEYTVYCDILYSCHIRFDKNMYTKGKKFKHITVDSTFYFLYWDDSDDGEDNPEWHIIDMVATTNNDTASTEEEE